MHFFFFFSIVIWNLVPQSNVLFPAISPASLSYSVDTYRGDIEDKKAAGESKKQEKGKAS